MIYKIDFNKAYDKVIGVFYSKPLRPTWCGCIKMVVRGGNVGIKINDQLEPYFRTKKGLRKKCCNKSRVLLSLIHI